MSSKHICTLHFKQSNFQRKLGELCLLPGTFPRSQILFLLASIYHHICPQAGSSAGLLGTPHIPPISTVATLVWSQGGLHVPQDEEGYRSPARAKQGSPGPAMCAWSPSPRAHPAGDPPLEKSPSPGPTTCATWFEGYKILAPDIHVHLPLPRCKSAMVPNVFCPGGHQVPSGSSDL